MVLVQTSDTPDPTSIAVTAPDYYVSFESRYNRLLENLRTGDRLRFKVFANASVKREGKRHGLYRQDDQLAWIEHQLLKHGAEPVAVRIGETSTERCWRGRDSRPISVYGVMFEGLLDVVDPNRVRDLVRNGLGHAKALGFGLVTLGR
mgnify:FL=1